MTLIQKEVKVVYVGSTRVRPNIPATSISLNQSSITLTTVWQTSQLTATLTPSDSTSTVTWSSSNTSIATVSQSWLVTCVTPWSCTITATTDNWLTATCSVQSVLTVNDYTTTAAYTNRFSYSSAFYWIKFTALKSWSIKEVWLFSAQRWTLKIAQGSYASAAGTEYNYSSNTQICTLSTPYQIVAWNSYVVSYRASAGYFYANVTSGLMPKTCTAVRYDYWTISTTNNTYPNNAYCVQYLKIEYTP